MKIQSEKNGTLTSEIEVTQITTHGIWLYVKGAEYFLSYKQFPWFKDAKVKEIIEVTIEGKNTLHWDLLDVDLSIDIIANPDNYPLISAI